MRVKPTIAMATSIAAAFTVLIPAPARAATCDVPSVTYPTIQAAEDDANCDPIVLGAGTFTETVIIERSVTIIGAGPEITIVDGNGGVAFDVDDSGASVNLRAMTITGGTRGVENGGTTTIEDSVVRNNVGDTGLYKHTSAVYTIRRSTIRDNVAVSSGGGGIVTNSGGSVTIEDSTLSDNHANVWGGGINTSGGMVTILNSTLSGNTANINGGGFSNEGATINVVNSTITDNIADADMDDSGDGGGFAKTSGEVNLRNSIVAGNRDLSAAGQSPDCHLVGANPAPVSQGHNIIGNPAGCGYTAGSGDRTNIDPGLAPLVGYGGPTFTHSPMPGSPAIDLVAASSCTDGATTLTADQRGIARPRDGDGNGVVLCDAGSVEWVPRDLELDARNKVKKGKKVKLNAEVEPCVGHEGDVVHFLKKAKEIAAIPLDADCKVTAKSRVQRKTTFTAELDPEADHPADSDRERVRVRKPRR